MISLTYDQACPKSHPAKFKKKIEKSFLRYHTDKLIPTDGLTDVWTNAGNGNIPPPFKAEGWKLVPHTVMECSNPHIKHHNYIYQNNQV